MKFFLSLLLVLTFSCFNKEQVVKNPCQYEAFSKDIAKYSQAELIKLVKSLESLSYKDSIRSGCQKVMLARAYLALGNASKASDYFSKAAKKIPELADYFMLAKADCELKKQNFLEAHNIAKALTDSQTFILYPQYANRVRYLLAEIAISQKDDQRIIKTHEELLAKGFKENDILLFNLATALSNIGEHEKANDVYKKLLINFPDSA